MKYPFYCFERNRLGYADCPLAEFRNRELGLPQCINCYHYQAGHYSPRYPVPSTIVNYQTNYGIYYFETASNRFGGQLIDGMPLFHGLDWLTWNRETMFDI